MKGLGSYLRKKKKIWKHFKKVKIKINVWKIKNLVTQSEMFISFGFAVHNFFFFQGFNISSFLVRKECQILTVPVGLEEPLPPGPSVCAMFIWEMGPWIVHQLSNLLPKGNHHQSRKRCWEQKLLFNVIKEISVENSFHCMPSLTALSSRNKDPTLSSADLT